MTDETEPTVAETANRPTDDRTQADNRTRASDPDDSGDSTVSRLVTVLNYAILGGLLLLAVIAAVQLYLSVSRTVTTFVVYEYRAPVLAAFNLVVFLIAALGISVQVRRLTASEADDADT
ncbi:hypothetical protein GL213_05310 [Halogeometricum borinquense]|uniref:DUF8060 domain-containing protein n=1 Tax=Halogeometricum borinquense TaxID=60847 RepID=A0A6C0UMB7_9EURY|nr:hypothetical protein [Halogeometricum borinquense]QIB75029.1 hypothetical protein G3I44_12520 [Halogeometricum borinquense]QIQ75990.1 hypothetical protein GL213_05310 [Halogeometricum borinquense]